jgi:hypothetical protein
MLVAADPQHGAFPLVAEDLLMKFVQLFEE